MPNLRGERLQTDALGPPLTTVDSLPFPYFSRCPPLFFFIFLFLLLFPPLPRSLFFFSISFLSFAGVIAIVTAFVMSLLILVLLFLFFVTTAGAAPREWGHEHDIRSGSVRDSILLKLHLPYVTVLLPYVAVLLPYVAVLFSVCYGPVTVCYSPVTGYRMLRSFYGVALATRPVLLGSRLLLPSCCSRNVIAPPLAVLATVVFAVSVSFCCPSCDLSPRESVGEPLEARFSRAWSSSALPGGGDGCASLLPSSGVALP